MSVPVSPGELDPVALENSLMRLWEDEGTFSKSIEAKRENNSPFTFLEGPPTANGKPGIHHVISRLFKDLVCRWKAMEGYVVERKGGWDTHGLPVEIEVQKQLDLMSNEAIEEFGMEAFNQKCKESVWTYEEAWREMTERMGFWVDMNDPYVTLHDRVCLVVTKADVRQGPPLQRTQGTALLSSDGNKLLHSRGLTRIQGGLRTSRLR